MKGFIPGLFAALLFFGCASLDERKSEDNVQSPVFLDSANRVLTGCYRMTIGNDTAIMHLEGARDSLSGTLLYNRFEKDDNKGDVMLMPNKNNGKLEGWYRFESEGKTTLRQIIFKITPTGLAEGFGEIIMAGDSAIFRHAAVANFEEKHQFLKIECK